VQLDEMSFPILLAWEVRELGALQDFDPTPMVIQAAGYLVREGPATPQERWEEAAGYSPSTLAANIAALTCAASFASAAGDTSTADLFQTYADFLACHVEAWTVTTAGELLPEVPRHYIRIHPVEPGDPHPNEDPNSGTLEIANRPPGEQVAFPARDVVDAGFLQLVRFGVVRAGDPLIEDSLRVVDAVLKTEFPFGPGWHRYNHDGYGQRADGGPYVHWGRGRVWPLLTGERGHYELAAGRDPTPYIRAMEGLATETGLLPEQTWDEPTLPEHFLRFGGPTGSANPLAWAHAEYVKLLRSARDGEVFDLVPAVRERYAAGAPPFVEVWKFNRQPERVSPGATLRVQALAAFRLRLSRDGGITHERLTATGTSVGVWFVDVAVPEQAEAPLSFTFHWTDVNRWEGRDFEVRIERDAGRMGGS
jgi:glucoamylase